MRMKKLVADDSGNSGAVIIDARPMKRYRAGHLPGAAPMFWETTLVSQDNPVLKSPPELRQMFAQAGATNGKKVVSYCEVGYQASYTYFVARYLGFDAAMYDGSYNEISRLPSPSATSRTTSFSRAVSREFELPAAARVVDSFESASKT